MTTNCSDLHNGRCCVYQFKLIINCKNLCEANSPITQTEAFVFCLNSVVRGLLIKTLQVTFTFSLRNFEGKSGQSNRNLCDWEFRMRAACPYSHWSQEFFATTNRKLLDLKVTSMCFAYHYIIDNSQWTFFCTWNVIHGSLFCRRHWMYVIWRD